MSKIHRQIITNSKRKFHRLFLSLSLFFGVIAFQPFVQAQKNKLTFLALGDSYTIGESVEEEGRWPNQLIAKLNLTSPLFASPEIVAKTGWTTDELLEGIENKKLQSSYDFVSLLIGVNNQYRGRSLDNFKAELSILLDKAIALSYANAERVLVLSIPDWGVMPFAENRDRMKIAEEINQFNAVINRECKKRGIAFFDITPISRKAKEDPKLVAKDGLHPSEKMYREWVDLIAPFFKKITVDE